MTVIFADVRGLHRLCCFNGATVSVDWNFNLALKNAFNFWYYHTCDLLLGLTWILFCWTCVNIFGQHLLLLYSKETSQWLSLVAKEMVAFFYQEKLTEELSSAAVLLFFYCSAFKRISLCCCGWPLELLGGGGSEGIFYSPHVAASTFIYIKTSKLCCSKDLTPFSNVILSFSSNEYAVFPVYVFTSFRQSIWVEIKTVFLFSMIYWQYQQKQEMAVARVCKGIIC